MNLPITFIVGPTGVGKSAVAMELAQIMNGQIVSCDAMQVYKEITIANDKPSEADLRKVPHHMISCVSVTEDYDVARYRKEAVAAIETVHNSGQIPIVVGGSGMYIAILLDGIFEGGAEDPHIRRQLTEDAKVLGVEKLYQRLKKVDPESAGKINPNDERRIVRALEVYVSTHKPISQHQKKRSGLWGAKDIKIFALTRERQELYDRVNRRVDNMFDSGLIDEMRRIRQIELSRTAGGVIGLSEVGEYIEGRMSLDNAKELMKMNTRHYVKRQLTWFRKDKRLTWLTVEPQESPRQTAERIRILI